MDCTPGRVTPTVAGKQMSSKLREKLKRCGRYHCSPLSNKKTMSVESPLAASLPRGDISVTPKADPQYKTVTPCRKRSYDTDNELFSQPRAGKRLFGNITAGKTTAHVFEAEKLQDLENVSKAKSETCAISELSKVSTGVKSVSILKLDEEDIENNEHKTIKNRKGQISKHAKIVNLSKSPCNKVLLNPPNTDEGSADSLSPKRMCVKNESTAVSQPQKRDSLQKDVEEKRETLRKLKMVQLYRKKNNLVHLETLICKWRGVSQQALEDLHEKLPEPKPSLTELVNHLQLDHKLIGFNPDEETFD